MEMTRVLTARRVVLNLAAAALSATALIWSQTIGSSPVAAASSEVEESEFGLLVSAPGAEETYAYCSGCHSEQIVAQQGLSRDDWIELLEWMVDEQGMYEIEEPDFTAVVDYLALHYSEDRPNFPNGTN